MASVRASEAYGGYQLLERIGGGSQAEVWLAVDPRAPDTKRVVKLAAPGRDYGSFRSRFLHEARISQSVDHPNVVRILDAGEAHGRLFLVMEHIDGPSWHAVIRSVASAGTLMPVDAALRMTIDALRGLQALHETVDAHGRPAGFVHRDLAPKNLMVGRDGRSKVIDLGIARSALRDERTATGVLIGTPGYMAPEQARGERVDVRCDVFTMGAVLFELLTLDRLIRGASLIEKLEASERDAYRPVTDVRGDVDVRIDAAIRRAVQIDRALRFETPGAFADDLAAARLEGGHRRVSTIVDRMHAAHSPEPVAPAPLSVPPQARMAPATRFKGRYLVYAVAFGAAVASAAWVTDLFLQPPTELAAPEVPIALPPVPVVRAARIEPSSAGRVAEPPKAIAVPADDASRDGDAATTVSKTPAVPRVARSKRLLRGAPRSSPKVGRAELDALMRRARRLAATARTPEALDIVVRMNRLSAEAQRGRPYDVRPLREALEALEVRYRPPKSSSTKSLSE